MDAVQHGPEPVAAAPAAPVAAAAPAIQALAGRKAPKAPSTKTNTAAGRIPAPQLSGLTSVGTQHIDPIVKASFGKLIRVMGSLRQAQAALVHARSFVSVPRDAPRQVKMNEAALAKWKSLNEGILELERTCATSAAEAAVKAATDALDAFTKEVTATLSDAFKEMLAPPSASFSRERMVESMFAKPSEAVLAEYALPAEHHGAGVGVGDVAVPSWGTSFDHARWLEKQLPLFVATMKVRIEEANATSELKSHWSGVAAKYSKPPAAKAGAKAPGSMAARVVDALVGDPGDPAAGVEEHKGPDGPAPKTPSKAAGAPKAKAGGPKAASPRQTRGRSQQQGTTKDAAPAKARTSKSPAAKAKGRRAGTPDAKPTSAGKGSGSRAGSDRASPKPQGSGRR